MPMSVWLMYLFVMEELFPRTQSPLFFVFFPIEVPRFEGDADLHSMRYGSMTNKCSGQYSENSKGTNAIGLMDRVLPLRECAA